MRRQAGLVGAGQILAHVPDLVLSGSKPARELARNPELRSDLLNSMRTTADAAAYLPNQVFIGAATPRPLADSGRPWWPSPLADKRQGAFGQLLSQGQFLAALRRADTSGLIEVDSAELQDLPDGLERSIVENSRRRDGVTTEDCMELDAASGPIGRVSWGYPGDKALSPTVILENTATKASAALALAHTLNQSGVDAAELDWVISCSEEAVGDRYQRGGGNLGKAIAELVGARRASGFDIKNFCAAPIPALIVAAALIESGVGNTIAVVAGGSIPKLGMKFQGHLQHKMPILEDCLGGVALLLKAHGDGPGLRLESVGRHSVAAGGTNQEIFEELVFAPLSSVGLKVTDVDAFATELHNPELTEPQGSGDVPLRNYRMIAALAARKQQIDRSEIDDFLLSRSFSGFAPTQGHIASAVCLMPHVLAEMSSGRIRRAQFIAKASLFLGKMSKLSDGASIIVEV